jgi:hypothetical protein
MKHSKTEMPAETKTLAYQTEMLREFAELIHLKTKIKAKASNISEQY